MTNQHPIVPPPELVQQWLGEFFGCTVSGELSDSERFLATRAAQWGADQELEACCGWLYETHVSAYANALRTARRPKPPSLAEEALVGLEMIDECAIDQMRHCIVFDELTIHKYTIRRALERLQELEGND